MRCATLSILHFQITAKLAAKFLRQYSDLFCAKLHVKLYREKYIQLLMCANGENLLSNFDRCKLNDTCLWSPSELVSSCHKANFNYACIVLNQSLQLRTDIAKNIWQNAKIRCLVDGGANCWKEFIHKSNESLNLPEYITGDFDSITQETRKYFNSPDIKYQHTPDQNETDFTKAVRFLQPQLEANDIHKVIVFQETTGRLDHIMANINTLHKLQSDILSIYLLSSSSLSWLLLPGKHIIIVPKELVDCQHWCALIPVGSKADKVTTTGLKWNLTQSPLEFGFMVSTSNTYASKEVYVDTDSSLIWSMGLWAEDKL
ncbi:thiamin pyrophosphokinase 1 isoform X1 [Bactrocera dorsalis]|uniref:Thiamin pyrophosphokinase 1 isoform X1 n=1 Tax=Bactrocera dorsalis TaxID=27457 RepID=A0A6I9VH00_BACDO|nr:thiamin pyrophosphokinase 1 isoform X1 [Bactrocera dorsalis]